MSGRYWLLLVLALSLNAEDSTPAPVRHGIERDGVSVVVDLALPKLPPDQTTRIQALTLATIREYPPGLPVSDWVARQHAELLTVHTELAAAHPDAAVLAGWNHQVIITTTWSGRMLSLLREERGYAGGNHGWQTFAVIVLDEQTLMPLTLDDLVAPLDQPEFARLLTDRWRQQNHLRSDERPSQDGLFVDELPARLPLITATGIEVVYQPYDVGPWSTGTVRVTLTRDQVRPFLRRDLWAK